MTSPPTTPSPSTTSQASLVSALSHAETTAHSSRLLFSPKSARTNGTGATGSTEPPGTATRSLVESVQGRGETRGPPGEGSLTNDVIDDEKGFLDCRRSSSQASVLSRGSNESEWSKLSEVVVPNPVDHGLASLQLPTPEPEAPCPADHAALVIEPALTPNETGETGGAVRVKVESDEDESWAPSAEASSAAYLAPSATRQTSPAIGTLTNSQEDALLATSVTRSQSDFSHWLEETLRLARGDGCSTIESDDALSSIIEATRHIRLGYSGRDGSSQGDAFGLQSESLLISVDYDEAVPLPDDNSTSSTVPFNASDAEVAEGEVVVEEEGNVVRDQDTKEADGTPNSTGESPPPTSARPWQLLSLALAVGLAYSVQQRIDRSAAIDVPLSPTRSLRFVPQNETAQISYFPTPLALGATTPLPLVALGLTVVAGISAMVPLLRRQRAEVAARRAFCTARSSSSPPSTSDAHVASPVWELNGPAVLEARELLALGIRQYSSAELGDAAATFGRIVALSCVPADKALASEWLGRTLYRTARSQGNNREILNLSLGAFERAIRSDGGRASPRASLGRAKFRLGDWDGAIVALKAAIKRDEHLAFAHEYLAKALMRSEPRSLDHAQMIEQHLVRAIELDPLSCTAPAALGDFLHIAFGATRLAEARTHLERAVALRADFPAAHARLAFIANETLDASAAATHYAAVVATRHTGLRDYDALSESERACDDTTPFLHWTFVTAAGSVERRAVLQRALAEHPHDDLVALLLAIEEAGPGQARPSAAFTAGMSPPSFPSAALVQREAILSRRAHRFPATEDLPAHGLWALALLALGRRAEAQRVYGAFWEEVGRRARGDHRTRSVEVDRKVGFLAVAFWELERARQAETDGGKPRSSDVAGGKEGGGVLRRTTRTRRTVKREEAGSVEPPAQGEEDVTFQPLRRSPRRKQAVAAVSA